MKIEQLIFWIGLCCILLPGCEHELDYYMGEQETQLTMNALLEACLLYTSDAADEL